MCEKKIKIKILDKDYKRYAYRYLGLRFKIEEVDNPDYVIYSPGTVGQALDYDCIRILWSMENMRPDFDIADYAIGFDEIQFKDRYLQLPYASYVEENIEEKIKQAREEASKDFNKRKGIAWIVSNGGWADPYREEIFHRFDDELHVDSAGPYLNNMEGGFIVSRNTNIEFYSQYKFVLALENSVTPGYITEKIVWPLLAGAIPIYWGDPEVNRLFKREGFINISDFSSLDECIEYVKSLLSDDEKYVALLNKRDVVQEINYFSKERILDFFDNIFNQPIDEAYRRNRNTNAWCRYTEYMIRDSEQLNRHPVLRKIGKTLDIIHKRGSK